ncbi:MAG: hypothetical protein H6728_15750 [Myxococcales bacterium]|nr:hypothetical protein [Myxococcales bacterium]MCB9644527.1 hypothetical protein [Myxococcales bacterium]
MMKFFFGQHFWIFIAFFITSASYLSALSVNHLLRLSIVPKVNAPLLPPDDDGLTLAKNRKDARVILNGTNMFDPNANPVVAKEQPKVVEKKEEPKKIDEYGCPTIDEKKEYPESKIRNLWLKGTSLSEEDPRYSLAVLYLDIANPKPEYDKKAPWKKTIRTTEVYRVGDVLATTHAKLCHVGRRRIVLIHKGTLEQISLDPKDKKRKAVAKLFGNVGAGEEEEEFKADRVDSRSIKRGLLDDWLANPMQHAMSARVMPESGPNGGFRMVWIKKDSLYSKLGLQSGDVLQQINGKKLSVGTALGLMSQLPFAKNLSVNLVRKGVRQTINFNIK